LLYFCAMRVLPFTDSVLIPLVMVFSVSGIKAQQRTFAPTEFLAWPPLTEAEQQQKSPAVEKDAGAEILLRRVHVADEYSSDHAGLQRVTYNYVRLKIFDEKGKEKAVTVDLRYREPGDISEVAARTIKADGTVLELDRKNVYKRDLIRAGGRKMKVVSFALPGVEIGAIVEYRWKQTENDNRFRYLRLYFADDFPTQKVSYFVKPLSSEYVGTDPMYLVPFNCKPTPVKPTNDGWNETSLANVPAYHEEPFSPSDADLEPWALLYYRAPGSREPDKYWNDEGKRLYGEIRGALKTSEDQKSAAAEAVSGLRDDQEKLAALIGYVRRKVRNVDDSVVTDAERQDFFKKLPKDRLRSSAEILKSGLATTLEMNVAFAGLAAQIGMDARPARIANRDEITFNPKGFADTYFLDDLAMAVKSGDSWKIFDVGSKTLPPGMLPWENEGVFALIGDPKTPLFVRTAIAPPESSAESRIARLRLSADGLLEGDVEESYSGHRAEDYRSSLAGQSATQREQWLRDRVVKIFPESDVTAIKIENADDSAKPLRAVYHLSAPRFGQVTGKRILFSPNAFRRSQVSLFPASDRRFPVAFPYGWKEADEVHIALPAGFELENAEAPGNLNLGQPGSYNVTLAVQSGGSRELIATRDLTFGNKGLLFFDQNQYAALKKAFDEIQVRDAHTLSLRNGQ
jgi:Domain of Unknown Function with PDB structure (DUF3857)